MPSNFSRNSSNNKSNYNNNPKRIVIDMDVLSLNEGQVGLTMKPAFYFHFGDRIWFKGNLPIQRGQDMCGKRLRNEYVNMALIVLQNKYEHVFST